MTKCVSIILISSHSSIPVHWNLRKYNAFLHFFSGWHLIFWFIQTEIIIRWPFSLVDLRNTGTVYLIDYNNLICKKPCYTKANYRTKLQPEKLITLYLLYLVMGLGEVMKESQSLTGAGKSANPLHKDLIHWEPTLRGLRIPVPLLYFLYVLASLASWIIYSHFLSTNIRLHFPL